jgi:hypothetical protein
VRLKDRYMIVIANHAWYGMIAEGMSQWTFALSGGVGERVEEGVGNSGLVLTGRAGG